MGVSSWMYSQMVYGVHLELIKNHLKLPASDYSNCIDYEELIATSNVPVPTLAILSSLPLLAKWCDTKEEFMEMKDDEDVQIQQLYATLYPLLYAPYEIVAKIESESKSKKRKASESTTGSSSSSSASASSTSSTRRRTGDETWTTGGISDTKETTSSDDEVEEIETPLSINGLFDGDYGASYDLNKSSMFQALESHPLLAPFVAAGIKLESCCEIKVVEEWQAGIRFYAVMPDLTQEKKGGGGRGCYEGNENTFTVFPDPSSIDPRKMFVFKTICRLALYPLIEMNPSIMMLHNCGSG